MNVIIANKYRDSLAELDIEVIKKGLNNRSFKFLVGDKYYVYRHPGNTASTG